MSTQPDNSMNDNDPIGNLEEIFQQLQDEENLDKVKERCRQLVTSMQDMIENSKKAEESTKELMTASSEAFKQIKFYKETQEFLYEFINEVCVLISRPEIVDETAYINAKMLLKEVNIVNEKLNAALRKHNPKPEDN